MRKGYGMRHRLQKNQQEAYAVGLFGVLDMDMLVLTVHICSGQDFICSPQLMISEVLVHGYLTALFFCLFACLFKTCGKAESSWWGGCVAQSCSPCGSQGAGSTAMSPCQWASSSFQFCPIWSLACRLVLSVFLGSLSLAVLHSNPPSKCPFRDILTYASLIFWAFLNPIKLTFP